MTVHVFKLPDIGEGTAEAELVAWHVKLGDVVEEDQPIADVMTDKATVEITAPVAGTVIALHGDVGTMSPVGSPLVEFETGAGEGADSAIPLRSDDRALPDGSGAAPVAEAGKAPATAELAPPLGEARADGASETRRRVLASPAVRARAKLLGVPLERVQGSGPKGRVRHPDLEAWLAYHRGPEALLGGEAPGAAASRLAAPVAGEGRDDYLEVKLVGLRRKIAEKMEISTRRIPHFAYVEEADVTELEQARVQLNARHSADRPKLTFLPFFVQALCRTLPHFPQINGLYDEEQGVARQYRSVHVGIATQTDNGLIVPVIRDAGRLGLWELAAEIARLAQAARAGTAKRDELSGSTITITSLGTLGGLATTPVINHPEVAIIGPNRIVERPVVRDGAIAVRKMMNISSSFDHRVVDGHDAARFVQELRLLLETPTFLLAR